MTQPKELLGPSEEGPFPTQGTPPPPTGLACTTNNHIDITNTFGDASNDTSTDDNSNFDGTNDEHNSNDSDSELNEDAPYFGDDPLEVEEDCFRIGCGNI